MKVYISGRIKGYSGYREHFRMASKFLMSHGHDPVDPCDTPVQESYAEYMREDIRQLLECEAIYMLEGWEQSAGARCEHLVAAMCGIGVYYEDIANTLEVRAR